MITGRNTLRLKKSKTALMGTMKSLLKEFKEQNTTEWQKKKNTILREWVVLSLQRTLAQKTPRPSEKKKEKKKISDPQLNSPQSHQFLLNFSKSRQLLRDHVKELQWRFYKHCLHSIGSWMWLSTCELNGRTHPETKIPSGVMSSTWDSFCHWITYSLQEFSRDPIEKLGEYVYTLS